MPLFNLQNQREWISDQNFQNIFSIQKKSKVSIFFRIESPVELKFRESFFQFLLTSPREVVFHFLFQITMSSSVAITIGVEAA